MCGRHLSLCNVQVQTSIRQRSINITIPITKEIKFLNIIQLSILTSDFLRSALSAVLVPGSTSRFSLLILQWWWRVSWVKVWREGDWGREGERERGVKLTSTGCSGRRCYCFSFSCSFWFSKSCKSFPSCNKYVWCALWHCLSIYNNTLRVGASVTECGCHCAFIHLCIRSV